MVEEQFNTDYSTIGHEHNLDHNVDLERKAVSFIDSNSPAEFFRTIAQWYKGEAEWKQRQVAASEVWLKPGNWDQLDAVVIRGDGSLIEVAKNSLPFFANQEGDAIIRNDQVAWNKQDRVNMMFDSERELTLNQKLQQISEISAKLETGKYITPSEVEMLRQEANDLLKRCENTEFYEKVKNKIALKIEWDYHHITPIVLSSHPEKLSKSPERQEMVNDWLKYWTTKDPKEIVLSVTEDGKFAGITLVTWRNDYKTVSISALMKTLEVSPPDKKGGRYLGENYFSPETPKDELANLFSRLIIDKRRHKQIKVRIKKQSPRDIQDKGLLNL